MSKGIDPCEIHKRSQPCVDCAAEQILRDRHSRDWYIGDASVAEWEEAYAMAAEALGQ